MQICLFGDGSDVAFNTYRPTHTTIQSIQSKFRNIQLNKWGETLKLIGFCGSLSSSSTSIGLTSIPNVGWHNIKTMIWQRLKLFSLFSFESTVFQIETMSTLGVRMWPENLSNFSVRAVCTWESIRNSIDSKRTFHVFGFRWIRIWFHLFTLKIEFYAKLEYGICKDINHIHWLTSIQAPTSPL